MNNEYKYLHFLRFKDIWVWSAQFLLEHTMGYNQQYALVPIGTFLTRNRTQIKVQDDESYKQITVRVNNGGACLRSVQKGSNIGTKKQYIARARQYILSKIDARNGAVGIVPDDCDGAIVTGDFPLFDIDESKINPTFLRLISTTKKFIQFAQSCSNGTTNRQRIDLDRFLSEKIPFPTLQEQEKLVAAYNEKIQQANKMEAEINVIERNIESFFYKEIEIEKQSEIKHDTSKGFLRTVRFRDIYEWGVDKIITNTPVSKSKYDKGLKIKDICKIGSGGTPSRSNHEYYKGNIPWIKTGEVVNEIICDTEEKISQEAIENSSAKLYPKGSLIIAMYGQGDTRGRTAKLGIDATTNQACAVMYEIDETVDVDYLWIYLQCNYHQLRSMASGNNQPNLSVEKIKNYPFIVPPASVQKEIVAYVTAQKEIIKSKKSQAATLRREALEEFENKIFE